MDDFFIAGQPVNVMADYCAMLPGRVMAYLFGMPANMDRDVRNWATVFMLSADISPAERQAYNEEAMAFFTQHARKQIDQIAKGEDTPGPLLNAFIRTEVDGDRLSFEETVRFCMTATVAGAETTSFYLGNLIAVFADFNEIWQGFVKDASQFDAIYKETLRFHGPLYRSGDRVRLRPCHQRCGRKMAFVPRFYEHRRGGKRFFRLDSPTQHIKRSDFNGLTGQGQ